MQIFLLELRLITFASVARFHKAYWKLGIYAQFSNPEELPP